ARGIPAPRVAPGTGSRFQERPGQHWKRRAGPERKTKPLAAGWHRWRAAIRAGGKSPYRFERSPTRRGEESGVRQPRVSARMAKQPSPLSLQDWPGQEAEEPQSMAARAERYSLDQGSAPWD